MRVITVLDPDGVNEVEAIVDLDEDGKVAVGKYYNDAGELVLIVEDVDSSQPNCLESEAKQHGT